MALGFLAAWQVLSWLCRRTGRAAEPLSNLLMLMMFSGIVGARLEYVREFWGREFAADPLSIFKVWQGGLVFYGGLIGGVLGAFLGAKLVRVKLSNYSDAVVPTLPLAHAIGRLGCFCSGCCYGKVTDSWIGMCFPNSITGLAPDVRVIPTQLIESGLNLILFAALVLFSCLL
jgi:phosphatidylglycerol:prolipoprotein diacylglycerol transferase